jgi:hypothetical protein
MFIKYSTVRLIILRFPFQCSSCKVLLWIGNIPLKLPIGNNNGNYSEPRSRLLLGEENCHADTLLNPIALPL